MASLPCARWNSSSLRDVDVGQPVAVGDHEGVVVDVALDALHPAAGHGLGPGVDQRHAEVLLVVRARACSIAGSSPREIVKSLFIAS